MARRALLLQSILADATDAGDIGRQLAIAQETEPTQEFDAQVAILLQRLESLGLVERVPN